MSKTCPCCVSIEFGELHAIDWLMAMCNGHDRAFVRTRGDREVRRAGLIELDNERMVAPDAKWKGEVLEQPKAIMRYVRGPAVHRATCTRDTSA